MSKSFSQIFSASAPIFSFEFFPPKEEQKLPDVLERLRQFKELQPDFMTVTYGAGGGTRRLTRQMTEFIASSLDIPAVAHLTCVGHSRDDISKILDDLSTRGIRHVLALRGDPPKGQLFSAHEQGFSCARDLTKFIRQRGDFSIATAGYPEGHPQARSSKEELSYLKEKEQAGAEVVFTQLFFEARHYFDFREKAQHAGIKIPILPGIMPVNDSKQLDRITQLCGASVPKAMKLELEQLSDDRQAALLYGVEQATRLCRELLDGGAPGIHFYTLNKSAQVEQVLARLRAAA